MATFTILVPAGIGDFSWLWSRLSTTGDTFRVEYAKAAPDRLGAFLALLPKDKILSYGMSPTHQCFFNARSLEMTFGPKNLPRMTLYSQLAPSPGAPVDPLNPLEPNTHLERGGRIETWFPDIPTTDFHYKINGLLEGSVKKNIFIVHLSSTHTFKIWKHYGVDTWVDMIDFIQRNTGWAPVFLGGEYDDFARQVYDAYSKKHPAEDLIGKTPDLLSALHLVQQCRFFLGCVSSGLTVLANVLKVPSVSWWPREKIPAAWTAPDVPYLWRLWRDPEQDKQAILAFLKELV